MFNENILDLFQSEGTQLTDTHTLIYCTAVVISKELGYKINENVMVSRKPKKKQQTTVSNQP